MNNLPNPFESALEAAMPADDGHSPDSDPPLAVAVNFEADHRFVLDRAAFMEAIESPPAFLASPGLAYLAIVEVLAAH